ncbi:hypothetical protein LN449_07625 [Xanthomonas cannabis]|uniref:hypothetical protein n=1 Tax=Xanthomonas cannabis TaxID=1885674 RepID=UPI001E5DD21D|nr:hypothetical protein [Xanthomonas cannabis]MCC8442379.1 hypothetical protein [Xanthomonas cannabis]
MKDFPSNSFSRNLRDKKSIATGAPALAGGFTATAAVVGGAAGAFAGSLASQAVGSAMGQTSFSWRNVAASTVAGAATAGFGTLVSGAPAVVAAVATAAVGNVSSYVANKLVGNEASFSWKSVAASAVAAGITQQLAPTIARSIGVDATQYGQAITSGITGGIVSAHVRQGIVGGAIDYQDVFVDAFGNAVNGALMQRGQAALTARSQSDRPSLSASIGGTAALSDPDYRASWLYGSDAEAQSAQIDSQRQYELDRQLTDLTGLGATDRRQQIADLVEEVRGGGQQLSQGQAQRFMDLYGVTAFEANNIVLSDPQVNLLSYVGHARLDDAGSFFTSELAVPSLYAGADEVAAWRTDFWEVDQRSQSIQPHPHNELQAGSALEVTHILSNEEAQQARLEQANNLIARDGRALLYTAVVQPAVAGIGGAVTPLGMSVWGLVQSRDMYQQGNKKMAGVTAALSLLGVKASLRMPGSGVLSEEAAGLIPGVRLQPQGTMPSASAYGSLGAQIGAVGPDVSVAGVGSRTSVNSTSLTAAERSAKFQGSPPYDYVDNLKNIQLGQGKKIAHITFREDGTPISEYFTTESAIRRATLPDGSIDANRLNQGLQIYASKDPVTNLQRPNFKAFVQFYETTNDIPFGEVAFGRTLANPSLNPGRYPALPQIFINREQHQFLRPIEIKQMTNTSTPEYGF